MPTVRMTQDELLAMLRERFGDDPLDWTFRCPTCKDCASGRDFREALALHPREGTTASSLLGQECIGRTLGALRKDEPYTGRGCDWCAYGLFRGPWLVVLPDGSEVGSFPVAEKVEEPA